ncbi:MAG TPA: Fur family transcriptional regulator [Armatimonadota bacterium]|nr:Fur family transcriptional regulator [Armatimonadota bacterium]
MLTIDKALHVFHTTGARVTPQRMMIVQVLVGNQTHPTVEDIFMRVRESYPTISLATVYHTLSLLAQHGLILELRGIKDRVHCDPNTRPHAHAYCEKCDAVFDLPIETQPMWTGNMLAGFTISRVDIMAYGECADCKTHMNQ